MSEAEVRGDEIVFDGYVVAKLAPGCPASIRERFERLLVGAYECQWPYCAEDD